MKKLLILFSLLVTTQFAQAQEWTFAPEAGLNISKVSGHGSTGEYKLGLKAGFVINMPLSDHMFLQPGLFYTQKGFKEYEWNTNLNYVELPLNLLYRFNLGKGGKLFASAGLYAAYAVSGRITIENGSLSSKIEFGNQWSETAPFDFGANAGIGYETPWNFYVRGQYGLGLISIYNGNSVDTRHKLFQITLGYLIGRN